MKLLSSKKRMKLPMQLILVLAAIIVLFQVPKIVNRFSVVLLSRILFMGLMSMSFALLMGCGGLASIAQGGIAGIAAYTVALGRVKAGWSYGACVVIAIVIVMAVSALFAICSMRVNGISFMMMTMCLANLINMCALQWVDLTKGYNGINGVKGPKFMGVSYSGTHKFYYIIAIIFPICFFLMKRLVKSPYGMAVKGMRDNSLKMDAIGFNTKAIRVVLFTVSGFFTAISGVMLTSFYSSMGPDYVSSKQSMLCLFMAMLGGIDHIEGALIGAAIYILLENFISEYTIYYSAVLGVIFTIVVFVLPNGILGAPLWKVLYNKIKDMLPKAKKESV
ncbi:MAG: branched-chain amino acid ABC transporter permease [Clostridia bacterium]|nr:branched-chain amino acid ABC transporter permease [Clostridia bacterium]